MRHATALLRLVTALGLFLVGAAWANPEPEIPVHCDFKTDGTGTITVEVDPRSFTADPMHERYLMKVDLTYQSTDDLTLLKSQAANAVQQWLRIQFEPEAGLKPAFDFAFTGQGRAPLVKADDPVVLTGTWTFQRPANLKGLRIRATKEAKYAVVVGCSVDGVIKDKSATLFPGEVSFDLMAVK